MGKLVVRGNLILNTTPGDGTGDPLLARDASTGEVGLTASAIALPLASGQIIVGNASNQASAVTPTGDVVISNTGVTSISPGVIVDSDISLSASISLGKLATITPNRAVVSNASGVMVASTITDTEISYLSGVSGPIQSLLNAKQATITGAASTITSFNLSSNFAVVSNGAGKIDVSPTTSVELGYLSGTTSSVQTQLNNRLPVNLSGVAQGDIVYFNGVEWVNLPRGSSGQTLQATGTTIQWGSLTANGIPAGGTTNQVLAKQSNTDYNAIWKSLSIADISDITATAANINILTGTTVTSVEFGYMSGTTANIQTQLNNKQNRSLAYNAMWVGNASNLAAELSPGTNGDVLTMVGSAPQWQSPTPPGNVSGVGPSTDNAIVRWNGTSADSIQNTGLIIDDSNNLSFPSGVGIRTGTSAANTLLLQAYDVDGTSYTTFGTLTANNTPTFDLSDTVTKGGQYIYRSGGTDVSLADGGTGASLTDPGADRILFWDDSGNAVTWLTVGSNLSITGTTLNATGGGGTSLQQKEVATTTYTIDAGDDNYIIYFTNAAGCDVTLPSSLTANFTFTSVRATGGGTVDHLAGGSSVINTVGGATDIQNEDTAVTWIYKGSNNWYGFGALGASGGAGVNSVTGTTNRIALSGTGTDPIIDIAATYVGQTSITTLGTIGTGVWNGTVVSPTYGGTGLSAIGTSGQLIRSNGSALEYFTPTYISGNQSITLAGDVSGVGTTSITTTISNSAVTYPKIQNVSASKILGRYTASTGQVQEISLGSGLAFNTGTGTLGVSTTETVQSGTTYTLLESDNNTYVRFTNNSSITVTLPPGLSTAFNCVLIKSGDGDITLSTAGTYEGTTNNIVVKYTGAIVYHSGSNVWRGYGSLGSAATGTVTNVSGTTNRIVVGSGTTTPVIDISSSYVGQASITTLGTITTGVWNGTTIATSKGGTGLTAIGSALQVLRVNAGGTALEYATPASGLSGSGTAGQVAYFSGGSALTSESGFEYDATTNQLTSNTIQVGSSSIAGNKSITTGSSSTDADLTISAKGAGRILINSGTDYFGLATAGIWRFTSGSTVYQIDVNTANTVNITPNTLNTAVNHFASSGSSGSPNGAAFSIYGGDGYTTTGNGNGGNILLRSGQRRTSGSGVDGDIVLDPRSGVIDMKVTPIVSAATPSTHAVPIDFNGTTYWVLVTTTP